MLFRSKQNPALLPIQIAYYTGLRIGEVCALTWQDIDLKEQTIKDNARFFDNDVTKVPTKAITMGSGTIMRKAKKVVLVATGKNKADAIRGLIKGEKSVDCPASVLQDHPDVVVIIDRDAASKI